MRRSGADDETAYDTLRRESMRARQSLEEYCEAQVVQAAASRNNEAEPTNNTVDPVSDKEGYYAAQHVP
jgi:hypothetical protein